MTEIPEITDSEQWILTTTLIERYGDAPETQLADADIRLSPSDRELASCPVFHWSDKDGCNFVVIKTGDRKYRCQFFYRGYQQFGTGVAEYDDLSECVVSLLQVQADHAAKEREDIAHQEKLRAQRGRISAP